jgi:hypothetical protein
MRTKIKEPEIYHDTMSQAIDTAIEYAKNKGYVVSDESITGLWDAMSYETYQTKLYTLIKDNKPQRKCLNISLYRMHSGRYELTTYIN